MLKGPPKQKKAELVISEWIETAKSLGREIPQPRGRLAYA
jgi:hypothetical protein